VTICPQQLPDVLT